MEAWFGLDHTSRSIDLFEEALAPPRIRTTLNTTHLRMGHRNEPAKPTDSVESKVKFSLQPTQQDSFKSVQ